MVHLHALSAHMFSFERQTQPPVSHTEHANGRMSMAHHFQYFIA